MKLGMVVFALQNSSGRGRRIPKNLMQTSLHSEFQASQCYIVKLSLQSKQESKQTNKQKQNEGMRVGAGVPGETFPKLKSISSAFRGLGSGSRHPHGGSRSSVTLVPGD